MSRPHRGFLPGAAPRPFEHSAHARCASLAVKTRVVHDGPEFRSAEIVAPGCARHRCPPHRPAQEAGAATVSIAQRGAGRCRRRWRPGRCGAWAQAASVSRTVNAIGSAAQGVPAATAALSLNDDLLPFGLPDRFRSAAPGLETRPTADRTGRWTPEWRERDSGQAQRENQHATTSARMVI